MTSRTYTFPSVCCPACWLHPQAGSQMARVLDVRSGEARECISSCSCLLGSGNFSQKPTKSYLPPCHWPELSHIPNFEKEISLSLLWLNIHDIILFPHWLYHYTFSPATLLSILHKCSNFSTSSPALVISCFVCF